MPTLKNTICLCKVLVFFSWLSNFCLSFFIFLQSFFLSFVCLLLPCVLCILTSKWVLCTLFTSWDHLFSVWTSFSVSNGKRKKRKTEENITQKRQSTIIGTHVRAGLISMLCWTYIKTGLISVLAPNYVTVRKEEKRASEICCPTQRNATFILVCSIFD